MFEALVINSEPCRNHIVDFVYSELDIPKEEWSPSSEELVAATSERGLPIEGDALASV
jgi:hypothetical protein